MYLLHPIFLLFNLVFPSLLVIDLKTFLKCWNLVCNLIGYDAPFNSYNHCKWVTKDTLKLFGLDWTWIYFWERWWERCITCESYGNEAFRFPKILLFYQQVPLNYSICGWRIFSKSYFCRCFFNTLSIEVKSLKFISNGRFEGNKYLV